MRVYYNDRPEILTDVGNGSYRYVYDCNKVSIDDGEFYDCREVIVWAPLSIDKITQQVINDMCDINTELKLVNDYNSAMLGVITGDDGKTCISNYVDYLNKRQVIKNKIKTDLEILNIYEY